MCPPAIPTGPERRRFDPFIVGRFVLLLLVCRHVFMFDPNRISTEPVTVRVDLPTDLAEQVRLAEVNDPELLRQSLVFGITHRTIFETLLANAWGLRA